MKLKLSSMLACPVIIGGLIASYSAIAEEDSGRRIEEVIVTAEKREATVSDTSISITAFDSEMIENLGLQSADELVNFIPATTRDAYDIRIRGVGRNFRALGGDPGVATYYNGIYSPDFGIAASENALYDLERVEVLRGPQGTLYGRNSIGGALNYVTKRPTMEVEGELRAQLGAYDTREFYGVLSGPLIKDRLAARLVGVKRDRDGHQDSLSDSPDTDSIDDRNLALSLLWQVSDDISWNFRVNDRKSDRVIPGAVLLDIGPGPQRGQPHTDNPVNGLICNNSRIGGGCQLGNPDIDANWPGAIAFDDPQGGGTFYTANNRPGVDPVGWPGQPNSYFGQNPNLRELGVSTKDPNNETQVNYDGSDCDDFPYTDCNSNHELFEHISSQSNITWDINDNMSLTYLFGTTDFEYTFNQDLDQTDADFTKYRQTVLEDVWNYSHELQLNWSIGDKFTATSGVYFFKEVRDQDYSLSNTTPRFTEPTNYGGLTIPFGFLGGASTLDLFCGGAIAATGNCDHRELGDAPVGTSIYGIWGGDERGDAYHHQNTVKNEATAIFTQGTYQFNDHWALVLGIRYAEDKKSAREVRGGWFYDSLSWAAPWMGTGAFPGYTQLAATNVFMGAATPTGDPVNPIAPVCPGGGITDYDTCATPLQLLGMPLSYTSTIEGSDKWSDTNFRVNVDWTPTEDILMYFSFTTGYRAGGYQLGVTDARDNPRDPETGLPLPGAGLEPLTYDKETVESIEIGYKGMHFDGTLQMNMSIYQYTYDGYQDRLNVFDPLRGRGVDIVQNANGVINRGFEVESLWLATERLTIGGNYSYTDAFYDDDYYVIEDDNPDVPPSVFGNATTNPDLFVFNAKGNQLKKIPEHKATVWGSYEIPTSIGTWQLRADYSYTGAYQDSGIDRELDKVPARHRVNAAIIWEDLRRRWTIRGFVDNVTDEQNLRDIGTASESGHWAQTGTILYPRYWGLDVTWRFGQ